MTRNNFKPIKKLALIAIILALILPMVIGSASCSDNPEPVTFGESGLGSWQLYVAGDLHLLNDNGLQLTRKVYDTGAKLQEAVISGEVDLALLSEYGVVNQILQKKDLSIIAVYQKTDVLKIIGRKDAGIAAISDLKGKRIGLARGTIQEFYLGRTLNLNGLKITDVTLVNLTMDQSLDALAKGEVDAILTYQPYLAQAQQQVPESVTLSAQSGQPTYNIVAGRTDWVRQHPEAVKRFLKVMDQANNYITGHPAETDAILRKHGYDDATIKINRTEWQFGLSLDISLLIAMQDEARWMIANNLTTEKQVPNFEEYVYLDGLKAVKPDAVGISK
jgi:NitT/TauT family transport system substrate-binding protein